jgi:hypothetical protein
MQQLAIAVVLGVVLMAGGRPAPAQVSPPTWRVTSGAALALVLSPGEIGRHPNATGGHEDLLARLPDAGGLTLAFGVESDLLGFESRFVFGAAHVQVKNEFGVAFPNHGEPPLFSEIGVFAFPFFPLRNSPLGRRIQPLVGAGTGALFASIDLDNIDGQSLHRARQRTMTAGLRILDRGSVTGDTPFIELRWTRHRVSRRSPLHAFTATSLTLGMGVAY